MNSLLKVSILFVAMLFLVAMGADRHHNLESFIAEPLDNSPNVSVKWTVTDVNLISGFRLERRMGSSSGFQRVNNGCISQIGSNSFECVDSDIYKGQTDESSISSVNVVYRLQATHNDGSSHTYGESVVEYTTNAVRRTWGSIKAMFQ